MYTSFDPDKNTRNIRERNLSFERVLEESVYVREDLRKNYPERRFVATGCLAARLHIVCFSPLDNGIRVISFRKANTREVFEYERRIAND